MPESKKKFLACDFVTDGGVVLVRDRRDLMDGTSLVFFSCALQTPLIFHHFFHWLMKQLVDCNFVEVLI